MGLRIVLDESETPQHPKWVYRLTGHFSTFENFNKFFLQLRDTKKIILVVQSLMNSHNNSQDIQIYISRDITKFILTAFRWSAYSLVYVLFRSEATSRFDLSDRIILT